MARGAQQGLKTAATGLANQQEGMIANQLSQTQGEEPGIASGYQSLVNWGSPQLENTYEQLSEQPAATAVAALGQQAAARAARTNNPAGFGALAENLAGQSATQVSQAAQRGFAQYANQQLQEQEQGLQGLSNLYGIDTGTLRSMLGLPAESLGVAVNAGKNNIPTSIKAGGFGVSF